MSSVNWSCSFPNEIADIDPTLDYCCFTNRPCAEYVCGKLNSTLSIAIESGHTDMYNCFVDAGKAEDIWSNPPKNGTCGTNAGSKGCVRSINTVTTSKSVGATTSATVSMSIRTTAASASASSSPSPSAGAGSDSAGFRELEVFGQTTVLGLVGLIWLIRRIW
ncbi:hypothetical protein I302_106752 [Kwoniella bestiolae CBS 10118]|uniref:Uncharacterized protein n=1 Tax=Kwoniella bestiolae CBS 10118 TaxID=1296100 RepID=A0A1B9G0H6_9TREE|nr:hypothetical protein I302_05982 [Kwoniella bestiolae CBS 10118]OCF24522.1 hypothetical protein I302_05982 [Kwoniella bestiolae CBS 10118]